MQPHAAAKAALAGPHGPIGPLQEQRAALPCVHAARRARGAKVQKTGEDRYLERERLEALASAVRRRPKRPIAPVRTRDDCVRGEAARAPRRGRESARECMFWHCLCMLL